MVIPIGTALADEWPTTRFARHEHDPSGTAADDVLAEWNAAANRGLSWGPEPGLSAVEGWSSVGLQAAAGGAAAHDVETDIWRLDVWVFLDVSRGTEPRVISGWVPATLVVDAHDVGRGVMWTRGGAGFAAVQVSDDERSRSAATLELSVRFVADADGRGYLHLAVVSEAWRGIVAAELVAAPSSVPDETSRRRR